MFCLLRDGLRMLVLLRSRRRGPEQGLLRGLAPNKGCSAAAPLGVAAAPVGRIHSAVRRKPGTGRSISPTMRVARQGLEPGTDLFDFAFGGNKELIFNFELEYPIIDKVGIRGVFFVDTGNAYGENEWFFQDDKYGFPLGLLYSWGFGFRWFSPIGPLRFEWGFPITRRPDPYLPGSYLDDTFKFEFTIGNFF